MDFDLYESVLDEISLEGLDGITMDSLWIRLNVRFASIENSFDFNSVCVQNFIFENIIKSQTKDETMKMYSLPEKRTTLRLYNRYDYMNHESGTLIEDTELIPDDIYGEVTPISDGHIRGSSNDYYLRKDVTKQVLDNNMSMNDMNVEFGLEKFVLVANQTQRNVALMGTSCEPSLELTPIQYCILERIGRQRFLGEITVGKESGKYKSTPKTLFYYRKLLFRNKLIKKKQCIVYNLRSVQNNHGLVFTLKRFFVERLTPMEMNAKKISELLTDAPNNELDYDELKNLLDMRSKLFRELLANYSNNFKVYVIKSEKNSFGKFVKLIKTIGDEDEGLDEVEDDEEEDDEELTGANKSYSNSKMKCVFSPGKILVDRPLLSQALALIESHESEEGICLKEIGLRLSLPKLETRSLVRNLERLGDISAVMVDRGRQKVSMFIPKCKINDTQNLMSRARKSLSMNETDTIGQLNRANIILDFVKKVKLVDRIFTLKQRIRESEKNKLHKVDTKSVVRIVHKLAADGHVRSIRTILRYQQQVKKLHFVCIPSITPDHPLVIEKINQYKFQWIGKYCFDIHSDKQSQQLNKEKSSVSNQNISTNKESIVRNSFVMNLIYQPSIARKYGLEPKLKKILTLYRFLFYLTHDFTKDNINNTDWRFNIEPLPDGRQGKVCTIGEIIPRMPLSIFVKIVWISYIIPGLQELLDDPIATNLTLSQISPSIRQCLLYKRKFAFNICEGLVALSYLDLVETQLKEQLPKEHLLITVKNTTSFINDKKMINYQFNTLNDFESFADALQYHCFKPCDDCSLDQRLFPHNLRNWTYTPSYKLKNQLKNRLEKLSANVGSVDKNDTNKANAGKRKRNANSTLNSKKICSNKENSLNKETAVAPNVDTTSVANKTPEEVSQNKTNKKTKNKRTRTKSYDKIDLRARRLLKKKRTDWTQLEDTFLLVCKVVSALLDPHCPHYICVGKNVVRDQLHKYSPHISKDKTALACQRRINYMLKNPNTRQNISDCIGEFRQEMKTLNISRPNVPKTHEQVWNEAFVNLLNLILNRMQSPYLNNSTETVVRINSIEDLLSRFNIIKSATNILPVRGPMHSDPNNVVDIHVNVVTNILLSSLLSKHYLGSNNKDNNSYFCQTLFKIYQKYPDSLIRSVIAKLGKYGIMTKIKKKVDLISFKSKGNTLYRISQNFLYLLQTKYALESLLSNNNLNEDYLCIKEGKTAFEAVVVTNLFAAKSVKFETQIPENIVILNDNCPLTTTVRSSVRNPYDPKCSSRYALHVLRQHINSMPSDRTQHSQDYLNVNQCKVVSNSTNRFLFEKSSFEEVFNKHKTILTSDLKVSDISCSANDQMLLKFIKTKKELGASASDIKDHCIGVWPKESLQLLHELKLVFKVGIRSFRWVSFEYLNPWLVHSPIDSETNGLDSDKNETNVQFIKFIARYWKRPDGTIDNKVLFKFLSGVLGHIMTFPGITKQKIIEYFNQSLQPVQLLEIIELLRAANCVDIIESPQMSRPVLFGMRSIDSTHVITHYISTPNSLIHLCRLKNYLNI